MSWSFRQITIGHSRSWCGDIRTPLLRVGQNVPDRWTIVANESGATDSGGLQIPARKWSKRCLRLLVVVVLFTWDSQSVGRHSSLGLLHDLGNRWIRSQCEQNFGHCYALRYETFFLRVACVTVIMEIQVFNPISVMTPNLMKSPVVHRHSKLHGSTTSWFKKCSKALIL